MAELLITDLPEELLARLAARAAAERKTLSEKAREVIAEAAGGDRMDLRALSEEIRAMSGPPQAGWSSVDAVQAGREDR